MVPFVIHVICWIFRLHDLIRSVNTALKATPPHILHSFVMIQGNSGRILAILENWKKKKQIYYHIIHLC